jgi:hypothetical protein
MKRRIGKFGKMSDNPDGKNIYCRDCMRDKRSSYTCTPVGMLTKRKTIENWKKKNRKRVSEYNKKYYRENRERILYNKRCREETECILITEKSSQRKINKGREKCIVIDPKRK